MPDGVSFREIQGYLEIEDKDEARNLINDALNKNLITKFGEKRATRYISRAGAIVTDDIADNPPVENKALETYLNDAAPVYDAVIVHIENIVKFKDSKTLLEFIQNGRKTITFIISWDHERQRNVIKETNEMIRMNYFTIKDDGCVIEKHDQLTGTNELLAFPDYEEAREQLRLMIR